MLGKALTFSIKTFKVTFPRSTAADDPILPVYFHCSKQPVLPPRDILHSC